TFPQSGVYTVIVQGTGDDGQPGHPLPNGQRSTGTIYVEANCTLSAAGITPAANGVAVGQAITVNLSCLAPTSSPPGALPIIGDSISGTLAWGDGTMSAPTNLPVTAAIDNNAATLTFSHSYAAPNSYNIAVASLVDSHVVHDIDNVPPNPDTLQVSDGTTDIIDGPVTI